MLRPLPVFLCPQPRIDSLPLVLCVLTFASAICAIKWFVYHNPGVTMAELRQLGLIELLVPLLPITAEELRRWPVPYYPWDPPEVPLPVIPPRCLAETVGMCT